MKSRHKKLALIGGAWPLSASSPLVLNALNSNIAPFISTTDVIAGKAPNKASFSASAVWSGGQRAHEADGVTVRFVVTDTDNEITVTTRASSPDLFKEGKGVVAPRAR